MKRAFVYVTDERGFELASYSAASLALSQHEPCDIHIFCYQFSPKVPPRFSSAMAELRTKLTFHDIHDAAVEQYQTHGHVTKPTLLKPLAVATLIDAYDRVVYLDNDMLVFDDLMIQDIEFGQAPIAAVIDMDVSDTGWLRHSIGPNRVRGFDDPGGYFNAGLMIFESRNWPRREFGERYIAALDQHDIACPYKIDCTSCDQCGLNSVFQNNWIKLPTSYNMQAGAKFTGAWKTATVRHYCGRQKFIPISLFRNDSRDTLYLNRIRRTIGLPTTRFPLLYEFPFRLNAARKYRKNAITRRFLQVVEAQNLAAAAMRPAVDCCNKKIPRLQLMR
jgi:lipopolysaccharide biosynthesis glycosyltransferase